MNALLKSSSPDITVEDHGSIVLLNSMTDAGRDWLEENVSVPDWAIIGTAIACEPRLVSNIITGALDAGLEVRVS